MSRAEGGAETAVPTMPAWKRSGQNRSPAGSAPDATRELTETIGRLLQLAPDRLATAEELYGALAPLVPYDAHERLARRIAA